MRDKIKSYRDLEVWKLSMDLAGNIYSLTREFPREEMYGLTSQMRKCAVSVPSNIAEGSSRRSTGEFIRFVNISSGSLAELETQLMLAYRMRYVPQVICNDLLAICERVSKMLYALQRSLADKVAA